MTYFSYYFIEASNKKKEKRSVNGKFSDIL